MLAGKVTVLGERGSLLDLTTWVLDRWGVVRSSKLSEKAYLGSLSDADRKNGVGLAGREKNTPCQ